MKKARIVRRGLAVLVLVYAGWLTLQVVTFKRYGVPAPAESAAASAETPRVWEADWAR